MLGRVEWIWKLYLKENSEGFTSLLFMDHPNIHLKDKFIEAMEKCNTLVSFIPKSLTFCLQLLDVSVNRLLKDEMKKKYVSFCMNQNKKEAIVNRDMIIDWITDI